MLKNANSCNLLLAILPNIVETTAVSVASYFLFGLPVIWAVLLG